MNRQEFLELERILRQELKDRSGLGGYSTDAGTIFSLCQINLLLLLEAKKARAELDKLKPLLKKKK